MNLRKSSQNVPGSVLNLQKAVCNHYSVRRNLAPAARLFQAARLYLRSTLHPFRSHRSTFSRSRLVQESMQFLRESTLLAYAGKEELLLLGEVDSTSICIIHTHVIIHTLQTIIFRCSPTSSCPSCARSDCSSPLLFSISLVQVNP